MRPRLLRAVFLSTFLIRLGFGLTISVYFFYLGSTVETAGLIAAAAPAIEASTVLFAGIAADRYGRLPILKWALATGAALLFLMSTTRDPFYETLLSGLFGLSSAAILAASLAVTGDVSGSDERGLKMGRFDAMNLAGWVYGFALGYGFVSLLNGEENPENLRVVFWLGATTVIFSLILLSWLTRGHREEHEAKVLAKNRLEGALLRPEILAVVLPWLSIYMLVGTFFTFLGKVGTTYDVAPWELGLSVGIAGTLLLFTQPFYGRLSDRWGRIRVMRIGVAGFLGVLLFGGLIALEGLEGARLWLIAGLGGCLLAALAFGPSSLAALTDVSRKTSRGTTMGLYSLVIASGMALGLVLSSLFFTFWNVAGLLLFFCIVGLLLIAFRSLPSSRIVAMS